MINKLVDEYIKYTSLWPQKRWAISVRLLYLIACTSNSNENLRTFTLLDLDNHYIKKIERISQNLHSKINIRRDIKHSDLSDDWTKTIGAVYRSLLFNIYNYDIIINKDYISLASVNNYMEVENSSIKSESFWKNILSITSICNLSMRNNIQLSYLYRISFYNHQNMDKEWLNNRDKIERIQMKYFNKVSSDVLNTEDIWNKLGQLVIRDLQIHHNRNDFNWILWGFKNI